MTLGVNRLALIGTPELFINMSLISFLQVGSQSLYVPPLMVGFRNVEASIPGRNTTLEFFTLTDLSIGKGVEKN